MAQVPPSYDPSRGAPELSSAPAGTEPSSPVAYPDVDERLVAPESRYEVHDGRVVYVSPADEPHASRHSKISALLEAYVRPEYDVASDMLTRTSRADDAAPDASVFPRARDEKTGGRKLEELAFEVVGTERLSHAGSKAQKLVARGVRRVFAVDVERGRAFEWSADLGTWSLLSPSGEIEDRVLVLPLRVGDLVSAAKTDDAVARVLLAKRNPLIEKALADRHAQGALAGKIAGKLAGKIAALLTILEARGLTADPRERARIQAASEAEVDTWLAGAVSCESIAMLIERRPGAGP